MNYSNLTDEELEIRSHECFLQTETLITEYKKTHKLPSRGIISTPEIDALRAERSDLIREYLRRHTKK